MPKRDLLLRVVLVCASFLAGVTARAQSPWSLRNHRSGGDDLWGIADGATGLVAVGTNGAILQSGDGQTWTRRASAVSDWLTAVTYGNGRYIAVGDHGRILSSADSMTWTTVAQSATTQRLNNVLFVPNPSPDMPAGEFVAVGEGGTIIYSLDAVTWSAAVSGTTNWLRGLAFGRSSAIDSRPLWITTGEAGVSLMSADGARWTSFNSGANSDLEAAAFLSANATDALPSSAGVTLDLNFAAVGAAGIADLLNFRTESTLVASSRNTLVPLNATGRFRCLVSGPRSIGSYTSAGGDILGAVAFNAPAMAIDDAGNVFSLYDVSASGSVIPSTAPIAWQPEAPALAAAMSAGTYSAAQDSFFVVGESETIYQRDQVFSGRAGNLSARGFIDQGENALIAGFVVKGSSPKPLLLRGVGPALGHAGVINALAKPTLTLYDAASKVIASNAGWGGAGDPAAIAAAATRVGAFPLAAGSSDAALLVTLAPGAYTAQITSASGSPGVALVEAYDLDPRLDGTSRAINLSTRGQVAGGENVLIAGLSVQGPAWRKFLVRGVGPSLAQFGVAYPLPDPVLDWSPSSALPASLSIAAARDAAKITAATNAVGAFALKAGAQDDALVVTLPPGNYTFRVSSRTNSTGIALIEIYEVPLSP